MSLKKCFVVLILMLSYLVLALEANYLNGTRDGHWRHRYDSRNSLEMSRYKNPRISTIHQNPSHLNTRFDGSTNTKGSFVRPSLDPYRSRTLAPRTSARDVRSQRRESDRRLAKMDDVLSKLDETNERLIREIEKDKEELLLDRRVRHRQVC